MPHYLIELPDESRERELAQAVAPLAGHVRWVALSPDTQYDYEWTFTDERSWDTISRSVQEMINDIRTPLHGQIRRI